MIWGMGKRRKYVLLVAIVLAAVGLVVALIPSKEPSYGGKRLSEWLTDPHPSMMDRRDAMRHIGTNAIPYLVEWIQYEPSWLKMQGIGFLNWLMRPVHRSFEDRKWTRARGAVDAFVALGPRADTCLPELVLVLNETHASCVVERTTFAIERFGDKGLWLLEERMTNGAERWRPALTNIVYMIKREQEIKRQISTNAIREQQSPW